MKPTFFLFLLLICPLRAEVNSAGERLAAALSRGDVREVEILLSSGINPDFPDRFGQTHLYTAATFGDAKAVELLLAWHADPNLPIRSHGVPSPSPQTPLQGAAHSGNVRIASLLLAAGARVNARTETGRTALHFAVADDRLDMIRLLIAKGADVHARDAQGANPLDEAAYRGFADAAALLLAQGAPLNEIATQTGATPINEAAYRGHTAVIQYLLGLHADLRIPDKRGYTPLQNAIRMGREDAALPLLEAEAKEPPEPQFFETTLDAAIRRDESGVVQALLSYGSDPSALLDTAAAAGAIKTVHMLLDLHADPNKAGRSGGTALEDASLKGFDAIAGLLLDHGARIDQRNNDSGTTPLYAAASFGKSEVVRLLLNRGANPSLCGNNRKTPYQAAVENGYNDVAAEIGKRGGAGVCRE